MKSLHWCSPNNSGMHHVAASMVRAELALGVEARMLDPHDSTKTGWELAAEADIHINHTHLPDEFRHKPFVFPHHGTPELIFELSVRESEGNPYNAGTGQAQHFRLMQDADAIVCFVPRHRDIFDLMTDKHTIVDLVPMGMDTAFWSAGVSPGRYAGKPSFLSCENAYPFKWAVDFLRVWKWVRDELADATLHVTNLPTNTLEQVKIMTARTGAVYGTVAGSWSYDANNLRNIFKQVDFYLSCVRFGDFNRMSMEAGASGLPVISYPGNPYADYWITEGDIRSAVKDLIAIGKGDVQPRAKAPIPSEQDMGQAMVHIYERVLDRPQTNFALGGIPDALSVEARDALLSASGPGLGESAPTAPRAKALSAAELLSMMQAADEAKAKIEALGFPVPSAEPAEAVVVPA